jgi:hypothetical protein
LDLLLSWLLDNVLLLERLILWLEDLTLGLQLLLLLRRQRLHLLLN